MQQNYFKRWLIENKNNELIITEKTVSRHMPINRMLDEVGFYPFKSITFKNHTYIYTYLEEESDKAKTIAFIGRFNKKDDGIVMANMAPLDKRYLSVFKKEIFKI